MIRLQKLLAEAGLGSRRTVEEWIRAGRLSIGARTAKLGDRATAADEIRLDGRPLSLSIPREPPGEVLLYYKPLGEVTTRSDPQRRPTVFERLPAPAAGRWISVGRLDVNTSGVLLLSTDGALAHRLMHPSGEVSREYRVRVRGHPGDEVLRRLLAGVLLEDGPARFDSLRPAPGAEQEGSHESFLVTLHEGRNREVRRLWEAVGFSVSRLVRVRYGPIELPADLRPGGWRRLDASELVALRAAAEPEGRGQASGAAKGVRGRSRPRPGRPSASK
jgi:23S rRNA pseudouridine2605 synthase